jgi:hypothetical protein
VCACHSRDSGKLKIGGLEFRLAWAKNKTYLQNKWSKKDWRCGPSGGSTAWQAQSPEVKPQENKKEKTQETLRYLGDRGRGKRVMSVRPAAIGHVGSRAAIVTA